MEKKIKKKYNRKNYNRKNNNYNRKNNYTLGVNFIKHLEYLNFSPINFRFGITICLIIVFLISTLKVSNAEPIGPSLTMLGNSSKISASGIKVNSSINGTISPGGYIFTASLTAVQQNTRWKGYVGNVTGTLTLDDANDNTLYQWSLTAVTGEVYATRSSGTVNWSGINCTWIADAKFNASDSNNSNRTPEHMENEFMSHTNKDDNITKTFNKKNHSAIIIGTRNIGKNECFSVQTYQRDAAQSFDDSNNANFTEVLLYDGPFNKSTGNVIYETKIENDVTGYKSDSTFDFQMIVPESGAVGFTSSTAYYFYVELT